MPTMRAASVQRRPVYPSIHRTTANRLRDARAVLDASRKPREELLKRDSFGLRSFRFDMI